MGGHFHRWKCAPTAQTATDFGKYLNSCEGYPRRHSQPRGSGNYTLSFMLREQVGFVYLYLWQISTSPSQDVTSVVVKQRQEWELSVNYLARPLSRSCLFACQITNPNLGTWCCLWHEATELTVKIQFFFSSDISMWQFVFLMSCLWWAKGYDPKFIISLQPAFCL